MKEPDIKLLPEVFKASLDRAPVGVLIANEQGNILYANEYLVRMTGYSREEIMCGDWLRRRENAAAAHRYYTLCRNRNPVPPRKIRIVTKSGAPMWINASLEVLVDKGDLGCIVQFNVSNLFYLEQTPEVMRNSDALYQCIVENSPDILALHQSTKELLYVSSACVELTGYTPEELYGGNAEFIHPEDTEYVHNEIERAIKTGIRKTIKYRITTKTGQLKWVMHTCAVVGCQHNRSPLYLSVLSDVTDSVQTSRALRESERRYRGLIESQHNLVCRFDPSYLFTFTNEACSKTFALSSRELLGSSFLSLVYEPDRENLLQGLESLKSPPYASDIVLRMQTASGPRWHAWEIRAIVDEGAGMLEIQAVGRDIEDSRKVFEQLAQSEAKYRNLLANSSGAVYRLAFGETLYTEFLSEAIEDISGYPKEYFLGKPAIRYANLMHPQDRPQADSALINSLENHLPYRTEYRLTHRDGSYRWILDKSRIITDQDGKLLSIDGLLFDITERKKAEEELEKAYNLQKEFINNITHEVRTPLTAVQGYVRMLLEGLCGPVNAEQAKLLRKVLTSSDHLLDIVTGILEVSRTRSGVIKLRPITCSPSKIVEKAVASITPQATKKGLTIDLEGLDINCCGMYDEQKMTIILTNLLGNAVKFTRKGTIKVEVSCNPEGTHIVVVDTGIGMDSGTVESVFDEFVQLAQPNKAKPGGFGIGLAMVAAMVDIIQGELTVSSLPGVGTAFTLYAPGLQPQPIDEENTIERGC